MAGWLGAIGPAPHQHFATASRLASWATLCPGNYMSAKKSKGGRTGDGGAVHQAAAHPGRLGRGPGTGLAAGQASAGGRNRGGPDRARTEAAITAIAHTLLKIAYGVLKTGTPYADLAPTF